MLRDPAGRQLEASDDHDAHPTGGVLVVHALKSRACPREGVLACKGTVCRMPTTAVAAAEADWRCGHRVLEKASEAPFTRERQPRLHGAKKQTTAMSETCGAVHQKTDRDLLWLVGSNAEPLPLGRAFPQKS